MNPNSPISDIMTTRLVTVRPDEKVRTIQDIFAKNSFHHVPVIDDGEKLLGIISKEDFFRFSYLLALNTTGKTFSGMAYEHYTAKDLMTKYPINLDPDDTVGLAADIFLANKFHALPIVEDGALVGIVTTHDLLQYSFNSPIVPEAEEEFEE